jgi:hypothetical protein
LKSCVLGTLEQRHCDPFSHALFIESFEALPSATDEESKLYAVLSKGEEKKVAAGVTSSAKSA